MTLKSITLSTGGYDIHRVYTTVTLHAFRTDLGFAEKKRQGRLWYTYTAAFPVMKLWPPHAEF